MNAYTTSHEFEEKIQSAMKTPIPSQEHLSKLRNQIMDEANFEATGKNNHRPDLRPSWAVISLSIVFLVVVLFGPQKVYAAIKQVLAYIPGIGLVEEKDTTRVLKQPITQVFGEVNFSIEQVFLDDTRTLVKLSFEGLPDETMLLTKACKDQIVLRLPDGRVLVPLYELGGGTSLRDELQFEYEPIPAEINQADLVIPCPISWDIENWREHQEFHLDFVPSDSEYISSIVLELPLLTTVADPTPTMPPSQEGTDESAEAAPQGLDTSSISLTVKHVAVFDDGFVLYAGLDWDPNTMQFVFPIRSRLLDSNDHEIPFSFVDPGPAVETYPEMQILALQASLPYPSGPVTLVVDRIGITVPVDADDIVFDIGDNPYNGPWEINQEIEVAGHTINIISVDAITVDGTYPGFEFTVQTDGAVDMPEIMDKVNPTIGFGGGPRGEYMTVFVTYEDGWPYGKNIFTLDSLKIYIDGKWEATWMNP